MLKNWKFEDKREDENVVTVLRQHPVVLVKGAFQVIALITILILVMVFAGFSLSINLIVLAVVMVICFFISFYHLYLWYNDIYILTNQRLIDVDQFNIFSRTVTETFLDMVEDVKVEAKGFMPTLFNFGNVTIQTAGSKENIVLEIVPKPFKVQQEITRAIYDYRNKLGIKHVLNPEKTEYKEKNA